MMNFCNVFLDMDGVIVDWLGGVQKLSGSPMEHWHIMGQEVKVAHLVVEAGVDWWANLQPLPDWENLWEEVRPYEPHILTALPNYERFNLSSDSSRHGKSIWNDKYTKVPRNRLHIVWREEKKNYAKTSDHQPNLLIDDHKKNIKEWEDAGGIGILHTSARETIERLNELRPYNL